MLVGVGGAVRPLWLCKPEPGTLPEGQVYLSMVSGSGLIEVHNWSLVSSMNLHCVVTAPEDPEQTPGEIVLEYRYVNGAFQCADRVKVTVVDVGIEQPEENQVYNIDHDTMQISSPGIVCEAILDAGGQNLSGFTQQRNWELLLNWTTEQSTYYTPGPGSNDKYESTANPLHVPASVFTTGGDLSVAFNVTVGNVLSFSKFVEGVRIRVDEDPSNTDFSGELESDIIRALAWQEGQGFPTWTRWNHYDGNGQPLINGVGATGIMNIRKVVWEPHFASSSSYPSGYTVAKWNEMAWNWKINITNGSYIHQTYMHAKQTATQKTWPATSPNPSTPNREDLASYGYLYGESPMKAIETIEDWSETILTSTHVQNIRQYKTIRPWE